MKHSRHCLWVLFLALLSEAVWAQKPDSSSWVKLTTPGMEVYTDSGEKQGKDLLHLLQRAEASVMPAAAPKTAARNPLRVIAFAREEEYRPFRLNAAAFGHYLHAGDRDYIVLADLKPEHYQAAVHEYTHYAVNRAGLRLPLWLNEGIADLYSTVASGPGGPVVGGVLAGRLDTLEQGSWLRLDDVLRVQRGPSLYSNVKTAAIFYGESWALTHMLAMDEEFAPRFPELVTKLSAGSSSVEALSSVYAKSPDQLEGKLRTYLRYMRGQTPGAERSAMEAHPEPQQATVTEYESSLALAELLAAHPSTFANARQELLELKRLFPGQPEPEELLGSLAWRSQKKDEAKFYWGQALEHGSHDSTIIYRYAILLHESGAPGSQVISLMEKALGERPANEEGLYNLGILQYREKQYKAASETLLALRDVPKNQAYTYYSVLGYCYLQMKQFGQARSFLLTARGAARTSDEQAENSRMLQFASVRAD